MRRAALGLIAMLITAGCLAVSASTESAESLEETAAERSQERVADGQLVALWGAEPPRHVEGENDRLDIYIDDGSGDGQAPAWAYAYLGADRGGIVVVGDEIGVIGEYWHTFEANETDAWLDEIPRVENWTVDSTEAAQILADDDRWPEITESWAVSWMLHGTPNGAVWEVEATNVTFDGEGVDIEAAVSATNGTILAIDEDVDYDGFDDGPDTDETAPGGCSQGTAAGRVTPVETVETEVELPEDGRLMLRVSYSGSGPLELAVLEDGDEEVWSDSVLAVGGGTVQTEIPLEEEDYVVEASTDAGVHTVSLHATAAWGSADCGSSSGSGYPIDRLPAAVRSPADRTLGLSSLEALAR